MQLDTRKRPFDRVALLLPEQLMHFNCMHAIGSPSLNGIEPPEDLIQALQESTFPDLWPDVELENVASAQSQDCSGWSEEVSS